MGVDSAARVLHYSMKLYRDENLLQIGNRFLFFLWGGGRVMPVLTNVIYAVELVIRT